MFRVAGTGSAATLRAAAFGGMAERAKRARALESLPGGALVASAEVVSAALATDFAPIGDHRASAAYRREAAANLVARLALAVTRPDLPLELEAL